MTERAHHRILDLLATAFLILGWHTNCFGQQPTIDVAQPATDVSVEQKAKTRKLILKYFPDLDRNSLEGWVDAYADQSEAELSALLQQRKLLGGTMPDLGSLFQKGTDVPAPYPSQNTAGLSRSTIELTMRKNAQNQFVIGHRAQAILFRQTGKGQPKQAFAWSFQLGERLTTHGRMDVFISEPGPIMFRLEPGCVLTRAGRFERLPDGSLGQFVNGKPLSLFPRVMLPEPSIPYSVDASGQIIVPKKASENFGQIQLHSVLDTTALVSDDGVYFRMKPEQRDSSLRLLEEPNLRAGELELSNSNPKRQEQLRRYVEAAFP